MKLLKKFSKKKFNPALLKIWLKKALYYISYPFRLWGVWLFILIVAYLGPTFRGVKPAEVHLWYWEKVTSCFSSISELFSEQTDSLRKKIDISNPFVKNKADILVSMPTRQTEPERKAFAKAETSPQGIDVMQQEQAQILPEGVVPVLETNSIENVQSIGTKPSLSMENNRLSFDNNYRRDIPSLVYLEQPTLLSGVSFVYDANTLDVNGTYLLLFGVYIDPETETGMKATSFLENLIDNKSVSCKVVALTNQNVPTGICFIGETNINKLLVLNGLSENVAFY